jgi:hypothetical protein
MDNELKQLIFATLESVNFDKYTTEQKRAFFTGLHTAVVIAQSGYEAHIPMEQVLCSLAAMNRVVAELVKKEMLDNQTKVSYDEEEK